MIRITTDNSKGLRLVVEGHLSGEAVKELRKSCAGRHEAGIVLDLSGVVFADRSGAELLKELSAAGFTLEGCSDFIKELLAKRQTCAVMFGDSDSPSAPQG
jgi:anti-anti-sigma regulatory factor